jgi:hypothetical protein
MQALSKRVHARSGAPVLASATATTTDASATEKRGPRNQPKRKGRK